MEDVVLTIKDRRDCVKPMLDRVNCTPTFPQFHTQGPVHLSFQNLNRLLNRESIIDDMDIFLRLPPIKGGGGIYIFMVINVPKNR